MSVGQAGAQDGRLSPEIPYWPREKSNLAHHGRAYFHLPGLYVEYQGSDNVNTSLVFDLAVPCVTAGLVLYIVS